MAGNSRKVLSLKGSAVASGKKQAASSRGASIEKGARRPDRVKPMDVAVIAPPDDSRAILVRELILIGCHVTPIWPVPDQLPVEYEVLYCELVEDLPQRIPWLPGEPAAALVVLADANRQAALKNMMNCAPQSVLHRPFSVAAIQSSLMLANSQFLYEQRLRKKIDKMEETIRNIRTVERAKAILMMRNDLDEVEAYRRLRAQAMERRISLGGLAQAIVDSQDILS